MFYANSGNSFPKLATQTTEAGAASLEAASEMFRLFAGLEARDRSDNGREPVSRDSIDKCIDKLAQASKTYAEISEEVGPGEVKALGLDELDLARVDFNYNYARRWLISEYRSDKLSIGDLYAELSRRSSRLASDLRVFAVERESRDLAGPVFELMYQWENMTAIARVVAVINRREPNSERENI